MAVASSLKNVAATASLAQLFVYGLLFLQLAPAVEAGSLRNFCNSLKCWSKEDVSAPKWQPKPYDYAELKCPNPAAPKDETGWNIYKNAVPMPSVDDIVKDLQLCGILNDKTSTVFYSFGAGKTNARKFIEKYPELNGKTINDALPTSWYKALEKVPGINAYGTLTQMAWIARTSQALARASSGDTYVVTNAGTNIYTVPYQDKGELAWRGRHNVWYDYEFATLQNNKAVEAIYSVEAGSLNIDKSAKGSWVRSRTPQGDKAENHVNADTVTEQSLKAQKDAYKPEEQTECGEDPDAITPAPKNSKRAKSSGAASTSKPAATSSEGAPACSLKPKTSSASGSASATSSALGSASATSSASKSASATSSASGSSSGTAKPTSAVTDKTSGAAKPTSAATDKTSAEPPKPTTLVTKTSSANNDKTTSKVEPSKTTAKEDKTTTSPKASKTSKPCTGKKCSRSA